MAIVKAVCTSSKKGIPKTPVEQIELQIGYGIPGDAHASSETHRQVSLLDDTSIDIMRQKGYDAADGDFGENIVTAGLNLSEFGIGTVFQLGSGARVQISQIGKACHIPCAIGRRIGDCIMPREGLFATVTTPGIVKPGDSITTVQHITRQTIQAAVITVSDRCSRGQTEDTSGPAIAAILQESFKANIAAYQIIPDEHDTIAETLICYSESQRMIDLIITTGGTGFAPRDVTPEATASVIDRPAPGIAEAIRQASLNITSKAMLSRATAGIRHQTLIVNLAGSTKAVNESMQVILDVIPHAIELLRNRPTDCGR